MKLGVTIRGTVHVITASGGLRCSNETKITQYREGVFEEVTCKNCRQVAWEKYNKDKKYVV